MCSLLRALSCAVLALEQTPHECRESCTASPRGRASRSSSRPGTCAHWQMQQSLPLFENVVAEAEPAPLVCRVSCTASP